MTNNPFIEAKQYWEGKLNADLPSGAFPADAVAKPGEPAEPADYPFELPTDLALKTVQMSAGSDERLIVIFIAGLAGLLTRYSQSDDYLIFMPIHRQEPAGKFINTLLPLSDSIPPTLSFKELILQVWRNYTEAVAHQNYPVERLLKKDFSAAPKSGLALGTAAVLENIHDDQYLGQHQFQAVFSFERSGERIRGTVRYHPAVYRAETIAGIVAHFISLLRNAYDNLEVKAARVEILSPAERQRSLSDYNRTDGDFPQDRTIQQLFEDQVKRGPEQTTLVFGERKITYRQLNAHANRLAWFLRRRGVRPGDTVGMIIDRSCEMII
jgi:fengycin family lipopeptide synthetase E